MSERLAAEREATNNQTAREREHVNEQPATRVVWLHKARGHTNNTNQRHNHQQTCEVNYNPHRPQPGNTDPPDHRDAPKYLVTQTMTYFTPSLNRGLPEHFLLGLSHFYHLTTPTCQSTSRDPQRHQAPPRHLPPPVPPSQLSSTASSFRLCCSLSPCLYLYLYFHRN